MIAFDSGFHPLVNHSRRFLAAFAWFIASVSFVDVKSNAQSQPQPTKAFVIRFLDESTGRPVPLVEVTTVHQLAHVSDNDGVTAWNEPELMGEEVHFQVKSHGYELAADGFGIRGKRFNVQPGQSHDVSLKRTQVAQRLYRITGAGRLAESQAAGLVAADDPRAVTRARVTGQDSVQMTPYQGHYHWLWGDTNRLSYPLGNFHTPSARTPQPGPGGWNPARDIPLAYFVDQKTGFAAETCRMPGDGPTWAWALATVTDEANRERLVCWYAKIKPPMETYKRGLAVWDDQLESFQGVQAFGPEPIGPPDGAHARVLEKDGQKWIYFVNPFPYGRVRATLADYSNPAAYEYWTCLKPGSTVDRPEIDRDAQGEPVFRWRRNAQPWDQKVQKTLVDQGKIKREQCPIQFQDENGKEITVARGTLAWNAFRQKWVMIFGQLFGGSSVLGEIWYAESAEMMGPWKSPVKIITHNKYSFYNVVHHPGLDSADGRTIYFEGTYTALFSGNEKLTPRHDYNQFLYQLDLADPRLSAAQK